MSTGSIVSIDHVLVSTADLPGQVRLFRDAFGLETVARESLDRRRLRGLWGFDAPSAESHVLETPGTRVGVQLLAFDPPSETIVRSGAAGIDAEALKVIDFVVTDLERASRHVKAAGFTPSGRASYTVPRDGRFSEEHVNGPEGVFCALLQMHDTSPARFVHVTDRLCSEMLGVSAPVCDLGRSLDFYQAIGLRPVYRYAIESTSFEHLVGAGRSTRVVGVNVGLSEREPMIGLIHYGLPEGSYRSLRERAVLPHRGLIGIRMTARSADAVEAACTGLESVEIVHPTHDAKLAPFGRIRSLLVRAPHGVLHHVISPRAAGSRHRDADSHEPCAPPDPNPTYGAPR